jgi:hypothetical protein
MDRSRLFELFMDISFITVQYNMLASGTCITGLALRVLLCCVATMITSVFEDCIEKRHGVVRDQPSMRAKVREVKTTGMALYFLSPNDSNEIESFYMLVHLIAKDVSIDGVN